MAEYECSYEIKNVNPDKGYKDIIFNVKVQFIEFSIEFYKEPSNSIEKDFEKSLEYWNNYGKFSFPCKYEVDSQPPPYIKVMLINYNDGCTLHIEYVSHWGNENPPCNVKLDLISPKKFITMIQQFCDELK